ncbi:unnamed protein product [Closterium sp. NIES-54]
MFPVTVVNVFEAQGDEVYELLRITAAIENAEVEDVNAIFNLVRHRVVEQDVACLGIGAEVDSAIHELRCGEKIEAQILHNRHVIQRDVHPAPSGLEHHDSLCARTQACIVRHGDIGHGGCRDSIGYVTLTTHHMLATAAIQVPRVVAPVVVTCEQRQSRGDGERARGRLDPLVIVMLPMTLRMGAVCVKAPWPSLFCVVGVEGEAFPPCLHSVALPCSYSHCLPPRTSCPAAARASRSAAPCLTPCCSLRVAPCCPACRALLPCVSRLAATSASRPTAASASRSAALRVAPYCSQRVAPCCPARRALLPFALRPAAASASRATAASASRPAALHVAPCCSQRAAPYCSQRVTLCCPARRALLQPASCSLLPLASRPAALHNARPAALRLAASTAAAAARATAAASGGAAGIAGSVAGAGGAGGATGSAGSAVGAGCATGSAGGAAGAGAARGGQRQSLPLPDDPTPVQLREWVLQRARPGGGGFGFLRTAQRRQLSASESNATLGASEFAAALGASESAAALRARASPATGPSSAEALYTFTLDSGASRCFFRDCTIRQVAASRQVSVSGKLVASCSCRVLSQQTLLWHHRLAHPSRPHLRSMHSRLLVSGLPRFLPFLPCSPAPPCLPCLEGRQHAAPHSFEFPPATAPLQTLHMDVWSPASVGGTDQERYFLLVVDDYTRYTTVFPLRHKADVSGVLIPWIRATRHQLRERFSRDFSVLRLHSDRGGEFSSDLLAEFCQDEGIVQSFTLPASPRQNKIVGRRIGLIMEVARTSMIHAAPPHFLWPFAVRYVAHQLNLWPHVSEPETSPILRWTGKVGDASVFRGPAPSGVSQVDPPPLVEPLEISSDSSGLAEGGDLTADKTVATHRSPRLETPPAETAGAEPGGAETEGEGSGGAATWGAATGGAATGGAGSWGAATEGADYGGPASPSGCGAVGDPAGGPGAGQPPQLDLLETLSAHAIRAWIVRAWIVQPLLSPRLSVRVVLPEPLASSLPHIPDPESDLARAASPTVTRLLDTVLTDLDLESTAAFALVTELVNFAARSRLDYVASLVTESESICPPSVGGELALGIDVLEDRQFELECLAGALPRFGSALLCPEGDPDALDIPTPRSYAEAIAGEYSS